MLFTPRLSFRVDVLIRIVALNREEKGDSDLTSSTGQLALPNP
jgi:hypothetical protein